MAASIASIAKDGFRRYRDQVWPDRAADSRRDHSRGNGDRHQTGHSFRPYRQLPKSTELGPKGLAVGGGAAAAPLHRWPVPSLAMLRDVVVFGFAIGLALAGLITVIITPPI
ncbi:MAG: hypothetical protein KGO48_18900 [Alphaproteobacteria bacterium]|nr:hypothetical protein [Alphaproteobacteria bacterium]